MVGTGVQVAMALCLAGLCAASSGVRQAAVQLARCVAFVAPALVLRWLAVSTVSDALRVNVQQLLRHDATRRDVMQSACAWGEEVYF